MSKLRALLSRLGGFLRRLRPGARAHREVAVAGPDQRSVETLVGTLLNATRQGAGVLVSDDPLAAQLRQRGPAGDLASSWKSFTALYTLLGRRGKCRRWRIHLPAPTTPEPPELPVSWKTMTDIMILDWPFSRTGQSASEALDDIFRLMGGLGEARERGRLRRAAIAVTGLPDHLAPRGTSQVRLDLHAGETFREGVTRLLAEGEGRCGHPLADPGWRDFLRQRVLGSPSLERLYEGVRIALGRAVPLVFVAEHPQRDEDATDLLTWIETDRAPSFGRRSRLIAALNVLVAVALVVPLALVATISKADRAIDEALYDEVAAAVSAQRGDDPSFEGLVAALEERADLIDEHAPGWVTPHLVPTSEAEDLRERADRVATVAAKIVADSTQEQSLAAFESWLADIHRTSRGELSPLRDPEGSLDAEEVQRRRASLVDLLGERSAWRARAGDLGIEDTALAAADTAIGRLVRRWTLTSARYLPPNETAVDSLGPEPAFLDEVSSLLEGQDLDPVAEDLQALRRPLPFPDFYGRYRRDAEALPPEDRAWVEADLVLLPAVPADEIIESVRAASLKNIARHYGAYKRRLRAVADAASVSVGTTELVSSQQAREARELQQAIDAALSKRPMTIAMSASVSDWHLHATTDPEGSYVVFEPDADDPSTCKLVLDVRPFGDIYITFCDDSARAYETDGVGCDQGHEVYAVTISSSERVVRLAGREFRVEVEEGWPSWPPEN